MNITIRKFTSELKYISYFLNHPFKGFYEIKNENEGSVFTATFLVFLLIISFVCSGIYGGYIFNNDNGVNFDILKNIMVILLLFFSYVTVNWSLTCLFDGEGSFKDIYTATAYAVIPLILVNLLSVPVTNILSLREAAFYGLMVNLGIWWTAFLIFVSAAVTHQYTFFKTLLILVSIIVGMCILFYIGLLFVNLIGQMVGFVENIILEISSRS